MSDAMIPQVAELTQRGDTADPEEAGALEVAGDGADLGRVSAQQGEMRGDGH